MKELNDLVSRVLNRAMTDKTVLMQIPFDGMEEFIHLKGFVEAKVCDWYGYKLWNITQALKHRMEEEEEEEHEEFGASSSAPMEDEEQRDAEGEEHGTGQPKRKKRRGKGPKSQEKARTKYREFCFRQFSQ